ncbi:MAG: glutathione S-transferase N-terminal domain-containing protein, partial [Pseudomonadota bacterium]
MSSVDVSLPVLYSFRRCPYAMRARMAIVLGQKTVRLREVLLRDKPNEMLVASPKGTVPVLVLPGGRVIDESLDTMAWAIGEGSKDLSPPSDDESALCGTEKIHFVYSVWEGRCWYLAAPSSTLSSNPDSWCPLAAALPGNEEFWDKETVYLYDNDGTAAALRWDQETGRMQVFSGASRTILPRIQSLEANFVSIDAENTKPVPWKNRALNQEKLARWTIKGLFLSGLGVLLTGLSFVAMFQFLIMQETPDLIDIKRQTQNATTDLLLQA